MGYHIVDPDALDTEPDRPCDQRRLSDAAGLENVAINHFVVEPGEQIPLAYHYHEEQEEAFWVVEGTLHVETPEGDFQVPEGSMFAVEPESPQRAHNPEGADESVTVIAIGAPNVSGEVHPYEPDGE